MSTTKTNSEQKSENSNKVVKEESKERNFIKLKSTRFVVQQDTKTGYIYMNPVHPKEKKEMIPSHTLIFLHGMSASTNQQFVKFNDLMIVPAGFRVVLPQAPTRSVKALGGKKTRAWFDQDKIEKKETDDYEQIRKHVD